MAKILFLAMTCREKHFAEQNEVIKKTWAKDIIEGKYGEDVDFLLYDGWDNQFELDKENYILHVRCEDDGPNTYKKTYYALKTIQNNFDYDFIFRTNTSTYVNVPLVLKLIETMNPDDTTIWTSEMLSLVEANVPYPLMIYGRGNGLILTRKDIDIIINDGINLLYLEHCDDVSIGNVFNGWWLKNKEDYLEHLKSYPHGWFRVVENDDFTNNHQLCEYYEKSEDFNFWKNFVTIQVKQYYHREDETENYFKIHSIFEGKVDEDIDNTLKKVFEYSKNPSIFIGSILGYMDYETWLQVDRNTLWNVQCRHKATNDLNKDKYYEGKIWY